MRYWDSYHRARGDALERAMEILTRDHLANPALGARLLGAHPLPLTAARSVPAGGRFTELLSGRARAGDAGARPIFEE